MKLLNSTALFLVMSLFWACGNVNPEKLAQATKEVKDHVKKFEGVLDNEDQDGFVAIFTDNGVATRPDGSVFEGKEQITELAQFLYSDENVEIELRSDETLVYPNAMKAHDRGSYYLTFRNDETGEPIWEDGFYRIFWLKQDDGSWKISKLNWEKEPIEDEEEQS